MADDTTITVGDRIAVDELTTLNGIATVADSTGKLPKAQRVKPGFGVDGVFTDVSTANPLPVAEPRALGEYMAASYRLTGLAATPMNLLTMENTAGATRRVEVRRISIDVSVSAVTAYMLISYFRLWHRTGVTPTGGTQPAKTSLNSVAGASPANTIVRFPCSADGVATAIVHALPARSPDRAQAHPQILTGASGWFPGDYEIHSYDKPPLVLNAGETLLVALAGANSAVNFSYGVKVIWEEF